jgi:hypothetical protein
LQLSDFKVGDRVQLSPATAYWMRGVRSGMVHKIRDGKLYVMLDRLHRIARLDPELIREIVLLPEATPLGTAGHPPAAMPTAGAPSEVGAIAAHPPAACEFTIDGQVSSTATEPRVSPREGHEGLATIVIQAPR